jgi:protein gp37
MAEQSKIEWTDHTFNPWEGCQRVAPECDHCYAENRDQRFTGGIHWGPKAPRRRTSAQNWNKPRRWNAQAEAFRATHGRRQRVFCASLADVFDNAVDTSWREDLWALIRECDQLVDVMKRYRSKWFADLEERAAVEAAKAACATRTRSRTKEIRHD